jgi:hypothetical protein
MGINPRWKVPQRILCLLWKRRINKKEHCCQCILHCCRQLKHMAIPSILRVPVPGVSGSVIAYLNQVPTRVPEYRYLCFWSFMCTTYCFFTQTPKYPSPKVSAWNLVYVFLSKDPSPIIFHMKAHLSKDPSPIIFHMKAQILIFHMKAQILIFHMKAQILIF